MGIAPYPYPDAMSAQRAESDVSLHVLLNFLAWFEGCLSLFLNRGFLPSSASSCIDSSSLPSPYTIGALSSSTGANSGLAGTGPVVVTVVPAQALSGPASEDLTRPSLQLLSSLTR